MNFKHREYRGLICLEEPVRYFSGLAGDIMICRSHYGSRLQNGRFFFSKSVKKSIKRSRPFVWLLARTWIRKNTDCFAVYYGSCTGFLSVAIPHKFQPWVSSKDHLWSGFEVRYSRVLLLEACEQTLHFEWRSVSVLLYVLSILASILLPFWGRPSI